MKKLLFLTVFVVLAIAIDGSLTYDFLDFQQYTLGDSIILGVALFLIVIILGMDGVKKNH